MLKMSSAEFEKVLHPIFQEDEATLIGKHCPYPLLIQYYLLPQLIVIFSWPTYFYYIIWSRPSFHHSLTNSMHCVWTAVGTLLGAASGFAQVPFY